MGETIYRYRSSDENDDKASAERNYNDRVKNIKPGDIFRERFSFCMQVLQFNEHSVEVALETQSESNDKYSIVYRHGRELLTRKQFEDKASYCDMITESHIADYLQDVRNNFIEPFELLTEQDVIEVEERAREQEKNKKALPPNDWRDQDGYHWIERKVMIDVEYRCLFWSAEKQDWINPFTGKSEYTQGYKWKELVHLKPR